MFGLDKIMGGSGLDLFAMMGISRAGLDILDFMKERSNPKLSATPKIHERELDGKITYVITYAIAYDNKQDAEKFLEADEKLRDTVEKLNESMTASADGTFPDGTPGNAKVILQGLFNTGFNGAVADGFPVEKIILTQTGN